MSRIFVVEDEVIISADIEQSLTSLGYEVVGTAQSGVQALLEVEQSQPDLVLMDIKLARRLDGIQTTAAIRKRWSIPVIYLTSHSDEATLTRAKETAPHGYLLKPFNERDLRTAIEVALRKHEVETKLEQRERWYSTTLASVGDAVIATDPQERITFMNAIEAAVARTFERLLMLHHDVFLETDPRKAISRLQTEKFDVVLCDMTMPEMNGMAVYEALLRQSPDLAGRVVFITGGATTSRSKRS
jgi:CheY-like chemotaxis protein